MGEHGVVQRPELPLLVRRDRGRRGQRRLRVRFQWIFPEDQLHLSRKRLQHGVQLRRALIAVRALEIRQLDQGDGRVLRPIDRRAGNRDRDRIAEHLRRRGRRAEFRRVRRGERIGICSSRLERADQRRPRFPCCTRNSGSLTRHSATFMPQPHVQS